jgi:hypothetical protein
MGFGVKGAAWPSIALQGMHYPGALAALAFMSTTPWFSLASSAELLWLLTMAVPVKMVNSIDSARALCTGAYPVITLWKDTALG